MKKELGRLLTAMVTPFKEDGAVDYEQAKKLALALLSSGSDGLVIVGTTGESPTLIREEELRLFREIKAVVGDKGSVIAGTGSNSTREAIEATQQAEKMRGRCLPAGSPLLQQAYTGRSIPAFQGNCRSHFPSLYTL